MTNYVSKLVSIEKHNKIKELASMKCADGKKLYKQREIVEMTGYSQCAISWIIRRGNIKPYKYGNTRGLNIDPYRRVRKEALEILGSKCCKCGFSDIRALQIDHINGGGNRERKEKGDYAMYKGVILNPEKYQLLCANCNWIKRHENHENGTGRPKK